MSPSNRPSIVANRESSAPFISVPRIPTVLAHLAVAALLVVSGCKEDCSAAARMGDFEASQGNWVNAVKQYEKALKADANCGVVGEKLAEAKRKVAAGK